MKKLIIILIATVTSMFAVAQNDTISVIGVITDIKPVQENLNTKRFKVNAKTLGVISGKIDSAIIFYIHSPAKQLLINDYQNPGTYKDKIYYFILRTNVNRTIFIDAFSANILRGKCTKCNQTLQGFRFINESFAHFLYYCPKHGLIDEEWEHYK